MGGLKEARDGASHHLVRESAADGSVNQRSAGEEFSVAQSPEERRACTSGPEGSPRIRRNLNDVVNGLLRVV
jgi:hypothetical protein